MASHRPHSVTGPALYSRIHSLKLAAFIYQVPFLLSLVLCVFAQPPNCSASNLDDGQIAFIQTGDELQYFADAAQLSESNSALLQAAELIKSLYSADSASRGEAAPSLDNGPVAPGQNPLLSQLVFQPPSLQFNQQCACVDDVASLIEALRLNCFVPPIGVPHQQTVRVSNPTTASIKLEELASSVHFHCSFFEKRMLGPHESTWFHVVFLPRQQGALDHMLHIQSSLGSLSYAVRGTGVSNDYRLRAVVGARLPVNSTLVAPIELHNPHAHTMRVTEMYTSAADLHLELPSAPGLMEGRADAWEIPPFATKTVQQLRYVGTRETNSMAYIRIRTNVDTRPVEHDPGGNESTGGSSSKDENVDGDVQLSQLFTRERVIVLPFQIEVTKRRGVFSTQPEIFFGYVRAGEMSRTVTLSLLSNLNRTAEITSIELEEENVDSGVIIEFNQTSIDGRCSSCAVPVAKFRLDTAHFLSKRNPSLKPDKKPEQVQGNIVVRWKGTKARLIVPYTALLFHGQLIHDAQETGFFMGRSPPISRNITLKNTFSLPLAIYNVSLPKKMCRYFSVGNMTRPVVIGPGVSGTVFSLSYTATPAQPVSSFVRLHTNLSTFDLPLHVFNGNLQVQLQSLEQRQFDFGLMDAGDQRSIMFTVHNANPVPIALRQFRHAMESYTSVRLLSVEPTGQTALAHGNGEWIPGQDCVIPGQHSALFEYSLVAPDERATYAATQIFQTPYETIELPVLFESASGAIISIPDKIVFADAFPGKVSSQPLQVYSTFARDMPLLRLSTLAHDPRMFFENFDSQQPTPVVKHRQMSYLGRAFFLPSASCNENCYVGIPLHTHEGAWFLYGMRLPANLPEIDHFLYQELRKKWDRSETKVNSTIVVDTTSVKHWHIEAEARLVWPRLMRRSTVHFPLTAVGNFSIVNLTLSNPSSQPVVVQLLPLTIYPDPYALLHLFKDDLPSPLLGEVETNETLMFTLRDTELFQLREDSPVPRLREQLENSIGTTVPRFTLSMMLQPGMKVRVRVGFMPKDHQLRSCLLLIRNNLTALEPVVLYGRGAPVELQLAQRLPRSQPLMFEIHERALADCAAPRRVTRKMQPAADIRREFTAANTGQIAVHITNITVNGLPCENRGFKVLNCAPFRLKPNETHTIEVAFTPDYSMSWSEGALYLYMHGNSSPWIYPMAASVPEEWLLRCQASMPRPPWESLLYYTCVAALLFLFVCVVASAYLEGDRIVTTSLRQAAHQFRPFDLNAPDLEWQQQMMRQQQNASVVNPPSAAAGGSQVPVKRSAGGDDEESLSEAIDRILHRIFCPCQIDPVPPYVVHDPSTQTKLQDEVVGHIVRCVPRGTAIKQTDIDVVFKRLTQEAHKRRAHPGYAVLRFVRTHLLPLSTAYFDRYHNKHPNERYRLLESMLKTIITRNAAPAPPSQSRPGNSPEANNKSTTNSAHNNSKHQSSRPSKSVQRGSKVKHSSRAGGPVDGEGDAALKSTSPSVNGDLHDDSKPTEEELWSAYKKVQEMERQRKEKEKLCHRDDFKLEKQHAIEAKAAVPVKTESPLSPEPIVVNTTGRSENTETESVSSQQKKSRKARNRTGKEAAAVEQQLGTAKSTAAVKPRLGKQLSYTSNASAESNDTREAAATAAAATAAAAKAPSAVIRVANNNTANRPQPPPLQAKAVAPGKHVWSRAASLCSSDEWDGAPEWDDTPSPLQLDNIDYDDAFDTLAHQSQTFASVVRPPRRRDPVLTSSSRSASCSSRDASDSSSSPIPPQPTLTRPQPQHRRPLHSYQGGSSSDSLMLIGQSQQQANRRRAHKHRRPHNNMLNAAVGAPILTSAVTPTDTAIDTERMQQLIAERHRRLKEYMISHPDSSVTAAASGSSSVWPGFGLSTVRESLWDDEWNPCNATLADKQPNMGWADPGVIGGNRRLSYLAELRGANNASSGHDTQSPHHSPPLSRKASGSEGSTGNQGGALRPEFKFNPAAQPFISSSVNKRSNSPSSIPPDPCSDSPRASPPAASSVSPVVVDSSIVSWAPPVAPTKPVLSTAPLPAPPGLGEAPLQTSNALGWSGSLFPIPSIWDPSTSVKNSWVAAGFAPTPTTADGGLTMEALLDRQREAATAKPKDKPKRVKSASKDKDKRGRKKPTK